MSDIPVRAPFRIVVCAAATLAAIALGGCNRQHSVEKLRNDQALLKKTLEKCKSMGAAQAKDDEACQNAAKASVGAAADKAAGAVNNLLGK